MSPASHSMNLRPRKSQIAALPGYGAARERFKTSGTASAHATAASARTRQLMSANAPFVATRLPPELLIMVIDHYSQLPAYEAIATRRVLVGPKWKERHNILRALSQTSRAMRSLFLPMLYEEVEACIQEDSSIPAAKFVAYVLRQQCLGLLRTPLLAVHVVTMTVSLLHSPAHPSLRPFAKCLAALPNLCYLRIIACDFSTIALKAEFQRRSYPQVMSIILPTEAHPLLLALPGLLEIIGKTGIDDSIPKTAAQRCHKVEGLIGVPPWSRETAEVVAKSMPNLSCVGFIMPLSVGAWVIEPFLEVNERQLLDLAHLSALPNLSELVLQVLPGPAWLLSDEDVEAHLVLIRELCGTAFRAQRHGRPKRAIIRILTDTVKEETLVFDG